MRLTGRAFAPSGITEDDLIHIVITGDTSQSPLGSSYKASLGEVKDLFGDIYVTGLTFNVSNYDLSVGRNDGANFTQSLSILSSDVTITGGTYNPTTGDATFTNNTGGTFTVTGFLTGMTQYWEVDGDNNNSLKDIFGGHSINGVSDYSLIGGGYNNIITGSTYSGIIAGSGNTISDVSKLSVIAGGSDNKISGHTNAFIGGGQNNLIDFTCPQAFTGYTNESIIGGDSNKIYASYNSSIVGGSGNTVTNVTYGGGFNNLFGGIGGTLINGVCSSIVGGESNLIGVSNCTTRGSTIIGGSGNTLNQASNNNYSSIIGGVGNDSNSNYTSIIGSYSSTIGTSSRYSSLIGGSGNTIANAEYGAIVGGYGNITISSDYSVIDGGYDNYIGSSNYSVIDGGEINNIDSSGYSIIGSGFDNRITGSTYSGIFAGGGNTLDLSNYSIINGGYGNRITSSDYSVIIGGTDNTIDTGVQRSVIVGGKNITATLNDYVYAPNMIISTGGTTSKLGINTTPTHVIHAVGDKVSFYLEDSYTSGIFDGARQMIFYGDTDTAPQYVLTDGVVDIAIGVRGDTTSDTTYMLGLGIPGDTFIAASAAANGLNIMNYAGSGTEDFIRFYAGQYPYTANTADLHIQGSGTTRGYVGVGVEIPTQNLDVSGNVRIRTIGSSASAGALHYTADGTLTTNTSDIRLKTNILPLQNSLDKVKNLRGVSYDWIEDGTHRIGFIAQEVNEVVPELTFINNTSDERYMGVHYDNMTALLVESVKEMSKTIDELKEEIRILKNK
jgi:hypothetical protein